MTLTKRVIACLDVRNSRVVKGLHFESIRDAGDPVELAKRYGEEGADELVFLDITASEERRETVKEMVSRVAKVLDIPFTVGGGVRTTQDAREILLSGADKVGINTAAVKTPRIISELADIFGRQCVVVAIDAKRNYTPGGEAAFEDGRGRFWFEVHTLGGKVPAGVDAVRWAREAARLGAGEILLTSIDRDGTGNGYDIELTSAVADSVSIPVVASGGCGKPEDMVEIFIRSGADAALAASIFHYNSYGLKRTKEELQQSGIHVRI